MAQDSCCAEPDPAPCCPPNGGPGAAREIPGYRRWPFVVGWIGTPPGDVPTVSTDLGLEDLLGRWMMRWGVGRDRYRIAPGLYAVGSPDADAPVLVTANYKMTFDALRRELEGRDLWILVLETYGINVWCAAGKGTFSTEEILRRVRTAGLDRVVSHRRLILPQLGAPGVAAHEVKRSCGFTVTYGPVRAEDLPAFLDRDMEVNPTMRRVTFPTLERLALTPVELTMLWQRKTLWVLLAAFLISGFGPGFFSVGAAWDRGWNLVGILVLGVASGAVLTPVLLPWLPWRAFSAKGALVGAFGALAGLFLFGSSGGVWGFLAALLFAGATASYAAMNFTGATPFTSPSGVEAEMRKALPFQAGAAALGLLAWLIAPFTG